MKRGLLLLIFIFVFFVIQINFSRASVLNGSVNVEESSNQPKSVIESDYKLDQYVISPLTGKKYQISKVGNNSYEFSYESKTFSSINDIVNDEQLEDSYLTYLKKSNLLKPEALAQIGINSTNNTVRILVWLVGENSGDDLKSPIEGYYSNYKENTPNEEVLGNLRKEVYDSFKIKNSVYSNNFIDWINENGWKVNNFIETLNIASIEIPLGAIDDIMSREEVRYITLDENKNEPFLDVSVPSIKANRWWNNGYRGSWVDVAVMDTGIDINHPSLKYYWGNFSRGFSSHDFTGSNNTDDINGHGTHVAGIVASSNNVYTGISPGVYNLINGKIIPAFDSDIMVGLDWALVNVSDPAEILSNSWGCSFKLSQFGCLANLYCMPDGLTDPITLYLDAAIDYYNVMSINAAGNDGTCGLVSLATPSDAYNIITVGSIDDRGTVSRLDDVVDSFSSRGPTWDGRRKPDVVAPGNSIMSTYNMWEGANPDFISLTGTSMAAPHVSGAAALLTEYGLQSTAVKALLINTAEDKGSFSWDPYYGWGMIDLSKSFDYKDYTINSFLFEGSYKLYKVQLLVLDEKATLVWNRHVDYNGPNHPNFWFPINDLDLLLYKETNNSLQSLSTMALDNVEQIISPSTFLDGVVKVEAYTQDFNHGLDYEYYSLATQGGYSEAIGPNLFANQVVPHVVNDTSETFNITVDVANYGDLAAHNINVYLTLPFGLHSLSPNPISIDKLEEGDSQTIDFVIDFDGIGTYSDIFTSIDSSSYDESFFYITQPDGIEVIGCTPIWVLNDTWSQCVNNTRVRNYYDINQCNEPEGKPEDIISTCDIFAYSPINKVYNSRKINLNLSTSRVYDRFTFIDFAENPYRENILCNRECSSYGFFSKKTKTFNEGTHNLTFIAYGFPETQTSNVNFFVDSVSPNIGRVEPTNGFANGKFKVKYTETNTKNITLLFGPNRFTKNNCPSGRNVECLFNINLSQYEGQQKTYYFFIEDIAGNSDLSRPESVIVDTLPVLITNVFSPLNSQTYGRYVNFNITLNGEARYLKYIDHSVSRPSYKTLCSNCDEYGFSRNKKITFSRGLHNITITTFDRAGNEDSKNVVFNVNY